MKAKITRREADNKVVESLYSKEIKSLNEDCGTLIELAALKGDDFVAVYTDDESPHVVNYIEDLYTDVGFVVSQVDNTLLFRWGAETAKIEANIENKVAEVLAPFLGGRLCD